MSDKYERSVSIYDFFVLRTKHRESLCNFGCAKYCSFGNVSARQTHVTAKTPVDRDLQSGHHVEVEAFQTQPDFNGDHQTQDTSAKYKILQ